MINQLISIDPGFTSSGTGIAYFENEKLLRVGYVAPDTKLSIREKVLKVVNYIFEEFSAEWPGSQFVVEQTYLKGKANISHLWLLGGLDYQFSINTITPLSVKKSLTGLGRVAWPKELGWTKAQVKLAEKDRIKETIVGIYGDRDEFVNDDIIDAVAIGTAFINREGRDRK